MTAYLALPDATALFDANRSLAYWFARRVARRPSVRHVLGFDQIDNLCLAALWRVCQRYDPARAKLGTMLGLYVRWEIHAALLAANRPEVSASALDNGDGGGFLDAIPDTADDDDGDFLEVHNLRRALSLLPSDAANLLRQRFGLDGHKPMTLEAISQVEHVSTQAIRSRQATALRRLRVLMT